MGKLERILVWLLAASLLLSLSVAFLAPYTEEEPPVRTISVILNETSDEYWGKFEKGIEQAALEYNADVNLVTLYHRDDAQEQAELMEYEARNGAEVYN